MMTFNSRRLLLMIYTVFLSTFSFGQSTINSCDVTTAEPPEGITLCSQNVDFSPDITIGSNAGSTSNITSYLAYSSSNWFYYKKFSVNGTLYINTTIGLEGCIFRMAEGASIILTNGSVLQCYNSKFFSCTKMWKGITIPTGNNIQLFTSHIEDALVALEIGNNVVSSIYGTYINRNRIGINQSGFLLTPSNLTFDYFGSNTFDCSSALLPAPTGVLYKDTRSYAGINLFRSSARIGSFSNGTNTFTNLQNGIVLNYTFASISSCIFNNNNIGIDASENSTLNVQGLYSVFLNSTLGRSYFTDNLRGINLQKSNATILNAVFTSNAYNAYGIYAGNTGSESIINISSDSFYVKGTSAAGIYLERSPGSTSLSGVAQKNTIKNNYFLLQNNSFDNGHGVYVRPSALPSTDTILIENNRIDLNCSSSNRQTGIYIEGSKNDNHKLLSNTIKSNKIYGGFWGIAFINQSGKGNIIKENNFFGITISNQGFASDYGGTCGIHIENSPKVTVCHNWVDGCYHGFHFIGANDSMRFRSNLLYKHEICIHITGSPGGGAKGVISPQIRTDNTWTIPNYTFGAMYTTSSSTQNKKKEAKLSEFIIESNDTRRYPINIDPIELFRQEAGTINPCIEYRNSSEEGPSGISEYRKELITTNFSDSTLSDAAKFELKFKTLGYLLEDYSLVNSNNSSFYQTSLSTPVGQLAQVMQGFKSIAVSEATKQTQYQSLYLQLLNLNTNLISLPENTNYTTASASSSAQLLFLSQIGQLHTQMEGLSSTIWSNYQNSVTTLLNQLNTIIPTSSFESAIKVILTAQTEEILNGSVSVNTLNTLKSIADSDYTQVSFAKEMAYRWFPICQYQSGSEGIGAIQSREAINTPTPDFSVFPNPASNELEIILPKQYQDSRYEIVTLSGSLVKSGKILNIQSEKIDIQSVSQGLYLLKIEKEGNPILSQKIVIIR